MLLKSEMGGLGGWWGRLEGVVGAYLYVRFICVYMRTGNGLSDGTIDWMIWISIRSVYSLTFYSILIYSTPPSTLCRYVQFILSK